jgi:ABC-type glycerol-3-phosphate transport system permease component
VEAPPQGRRRNELVVAAALAVAGALAVTLWGGYARGWHWTGYARNATLWDWLNLTLLPLALAAVPLWVRYRRRLGRTHHTAVLGTAAAFALLVVLGYALHWAWTGFPGNRLWDWLELLVLPLAIALVPVWSEASSRPRPHHLAGIAAAAAALAVAAVGGYDYGWRWTGFQGNTLFDWLHLLAAPVVVPLILVPLATGWMKAEANAPAETEAPAPSPSGFEPETALDP